VIVYQNLCEKESHIAKLKESETKSELCDSTHSDLESTNNETVRDTPQNNKEFECNSCEDIFETNPLISTASVFFPSVQVCNKNEEDTPVHDVTILVERDAKVDNQLNQLYAAQNMKHDESIGKISDLNMQNIMVSDCDKSHVLNRLDHTICADLIVLYDHTFAESLQVDNHCPIIYDPFLCFDMADLHDTLHSYIKYYARK
jgi:hypothetical protein